MKKNKERSKKSFCRGIICQKFKRIKCKKCKIYVCVFCSIVVNRKNYCIDCGVNVFLEQESKEWINALKDFGF